MYYAQYSRDSTNFYFILRTVQTRHAHYLTTKFRSKEMIMSITEWLYLYGFVPRIITKQITALSH